MIAKKDKFLIFLINSIEKIKKVWYYIKDE